MSAGELLFVGGGDDLLEPPPVDPELLSGSGSENIRVSLCYVVPAPTVLHERSYVPPGERTRKRNLTRASAGAVFVGAAEDSKAGWREEDPRDSPGLTLIFFGDCRPPPIWRVIHYHAGVARISSVHCILGALYYSSFRIQRRHR